MNDPRHTPAALYPRGKDPPVRIGQEAAWAPEPVWTQRLEGKIFRLCRGSNLDHPVIQTVMRHYTDWATPAPNVFIVLFQLFITIELKWQRTSLEEGFQHYVQWKIYCVLIYSGLKMEAHRLQRIVGEIDVEHILHTPTLWRISYFRLSRLRIEMGGGDWTCRKWPTLFFFTATELAFSRPVHIFLTPLTLLWFFIPCRHILIAPLYPKSQNLDVHFSYKLKKNMPISCGKNKLLEFFVADMKFLWLLDTFEWSVPMLLRTFSTLNIRPT
jgi:hypothetical protein